MTVHLTDQEARVLGCLMEKSVVTPDQYPLTLNGLTNACNQKSSRHPVMALDPGAVQNTVRKLQAKHLLVAEPNFKNQVEKYGQRFCNTPFSNFQFNPAQFSVICTLLLRGARTPGELRANSGRLHTFADNHEVAATLQSLMEIDRGPLVVELPLTPGRRDAEFMHLLCGDVDIAELQSKAPPPATISQPDPSPNGSLAARVTSLEQQVAELQAALAGLAAPAD